MIVSDILHDVRVRDERLPSGPSEEVLSLIRALDKQSLSNSFDGHKDRAGYNSVDSRVSVSPDVFVKTQVSEKTLAVYAERGRLLEQRFRREMGMPWEQEMSWETYVHWLLSQKSLYKSSTWRTYRSASYYLIEGCPTEDAQRALALLDADVLDVSREINEDDDVRLEPRSSSLKEKKFPIKDFNRVILYLQQRTKSK